MTIDLQQFKNKVEARNPGHINRWTECCDWYFNEIELFHERSSWAQKFGMTGLEYWSNSIYTVLSLAESDAKKFGAIIQKSWYCDDENPTWFLIFNDLDKVIEYSHYQITKK